MTSVSGRNSGVMTWLHDKLGALVHNEDGVTAIEYGLIGAGMAVVIVVTFGPSDGDGIVGQLTTTFNQIAGYLGDYNSSMNGPMNPTPNN